MRHSDILIPQRWFITEAKVRIEHPEDLIFTERSHGARRALNAMIHAAEDPHTVSIKWDGSPALIFGRDYDNGLVLTDKSGFNSKKTGGMPRSIEGVKQMLFMRKPDQTGRSEYADSIANLYPLLNKAVPLSFKGYLQGDVLWTSRPPVVNGNYVFTPNKITYSIPVNSPLGNNIANSAAGIVVHSQFDGQDNDDSRAINNLTKLGLINVPGLLIMGPNATNLESTPLPSNIKSSVTAIIQKSAVAIDEFLDPAALNTAQLTDFGSKMKQYVAYRASHGITGLSNATQGFISWISSSDSKLTDRKRANMLDWIKTHHRGYIATWQIAEQLSKLKDLIRDGVDQQVGTNIGAELRGQQGHEGYVADTPSGKIKLVNRPHFMRKDITI
jgi:hypothetical protein